MYSRKKLYYKKVIPVTHTNRMLISLMTLFLDLTSIFKSHSKLELLVTKLRIEPLALHYYKSAPNHWTTHLLLDKIASYTENI
jgi:hypothetical protein